MEMKILHEDEVWKYNTCFQISIQIKYKKIMILVTLCAIAIFIQTSDILYFYFFVVVNIIKEKNVFNLYYKLYQSYIYPERYDENDNTLKYLINNYTSFKVSAPMSGMLSP